MTRAIKMYTGSDGHTHTETGTVYEDVITRASSIRFKETAPYTSYDWHTAPDIQYVITLCGTLEFETALGEKFIIRPGDVLIAMDISGSGHRWKMLEDQPWRRAYVAFDENMEINFIPGITA